ncbi:GPI transamidase subunit PIG-U [Neohortaea acidophila]|uniref:GPI transamidase subunit PIG-U n=1 Tax=Neohortaea acidophila TaxID=245834 RepID=A0A6A6PWM4_9PEZI|nr:GPI transamidase subunit PIG-U [Neohortaea acidophila]KAF2483893.1 GPI transamidase subunit PIG-U [Neohortaea acidophila]
MEALTRVYNDHPKTLLFTSAAVIRILLAIAWPALPDLLTSRVEISTAVNSFKRLQEGLFLYDHGLDPYDGGIFHQAPLFLPLFSLLPSPQESIGRLISVLLYTALDLFSAELLCQIADSGAATQSTSYTSPRRQRTWRSISVVAIYLFNPYTLLTCLGRPTTIFTTFFVLLSISHACQARMATSAFALAVASYISLHPAFLLPPIGVLCYDRVCLQRISSSSQNAKPTTSKANVTIDQHRFPSALQFAFSMLTTYASTTALLLALSRLLLPSWTFIPSVYLTPLQLPDLTPNTGLWWYFFTEMFEPFRNFFLGVFWLHMFSYSIPLSLRLRKQPLASVVLMWGICCVLEPYAHIGAVGGAGSLLCCVGHVFELSTAHRYTFPALAALLYCTLLGPAFHHLWIYAGSGNANFFYAITLVWNLGLFILLTDTLYAVLRDEWECERPEGKGKDVRQI